MRKDSVYCEYCDSVQSGSMHGCSNCGANLLNIETYSLRREHLRTEIVQIMHRTQSHSGMSRVKIGAAVLSFAVFTGLLWQEAQNDGSDGNRFFGRDVPSSDHATIEWSRE